MSNLDALSEQDRNRYDFLQEQIIESDSKADHYETTYALWMARVEALKDSLAETLKRTSDGEIRPTGEDIRAMRSEVRNAERKASETAEFALNFRTRIGDLRTSAQWIIDRSISKPLNENALLRRQIEILSTQLQALQVPGPAA